MPGAGKMRAGFGPAGLGTPVSATASPVGAAGTRFIDPVTRDYQQDSSTRHLKQMPAVRQRVLVALLTVIRSSTVQSKFGVLMPRKIGNRFSGEVQQSVRAALKQMTDVEKVMRIDGITVETGGSRARVTVAFTDLTTGLRDSVATP